MGDEKEKKEKINDLELMGAVQQFADEFIENYEILDTESVREFLKSKHIQGIAPQLKLTENIINLLLLITIDSAFYDNYLGESLGDKTLSFFSEVQKLLQESAKKDKPTTDKLVSHFLNLTAIKKIEKVNPALIEKMLMDDKMVDIEHKYQDNESVEFNKIESDLNRAVYEVKQKGKKIANLPSNTELLTQRILKLLNDSLQTARYFFGLMIALLDLLSNRLERKTESYFSEHNSYVLLYNRNGICNNKCIMSCLKYYTEKPEYKQNLTSIKRVIERHLLKEFKGLRIHFAHWEADTVQDSLQEEIYHIKVKEKKVSYTLQELKDIWYDYSTLFLKFKLIVAREFYSDADLISYVRKIPKPIEYQVYPGKIVVKKEEKSNKKEN